MLVVTRTSAIARAKQKPRQWGPISAVRAAVRRNAERLGIDPASIVGLWPFWEGGGDVREVCNDLIATPDASTSWQSGYMSFSTDTSYDGARIYGSDTGLLDFVSDFSFVAVVRPTVGYTSKDYRAIIAKRDNTGYQYHFRIKTSSGYLSLLTSGGSIDTTHTIPLNKWSNVCVARDSTSTRFFVNGTRVHSAVSASISHVSTDVTLGNTVYDLNLADYLGFGGDIALIIAIGAALSDLGACSITEDPYALIRPTPVPLWFDFGASGTDVNISSSPLAGTTSISGGHVINILKQSSPLEATGLLDGGHVINVLVPAGVLSSTGYVLGSHRISVLVDASANEAQGALSGGYYIDVNVLADILSASGELLGSVQIGGSVNISADALVGLASLLGHSVVSVEQAADVLSAEGLLSGSGHVDVNAVADALSGTGEIDGSHIISVNKTAQVLEATGALLGQGYQGINIPASPLVAQGSISGGSIISVNVSSQELSASGLIDGDFIVSVLKAADALLAQGMLSGAVLTIGPGRLRDVDTEIVSATPLRVVVSVTPKRTIERS